MSFKEIEKHVLDDAVELIATIGVANPLMHTHTIHEMTGSKKEVALFLRSTLARHVISVVTRLHALKGAGRTGETASIDSYLHYAEAEAKLTPEQCATFRSEREELIDKLTSQGINFSDLIAFRNAELAHSLHCSPPLSNQLASLPIWDFAHDTYEMVLKIEKAASGVARLDVRFQEWLDHGIEFWPSPPVQDYRLPD